jgi:hypothetical protein
VRRVSLCAGIERRVPLFIGRGGGRGARDRSTAGSLFQGSEGASDGRVV